jgi:SAM-dependent methyltransferase
MLKKILQWIAQKQFEPGILGVFVNPFYSTRKCLFRNMKELGAKITGKTLDIGCGQKPYEHLCSSSEYIGLDVENPHHPNHKADMFYDGNIFPFEDESFDSVICNQVFEHVFNPDDFLGEINRVLKDNGRLLMTVPFVWGEHEQPNDYARYTTFAMCSILKKNGFSISIQRKTLNDFRLISQLLSANIYNYFYYKSTPKIILGIITVLFLAPLNILGELIAAVTPKNNDLYMDQIIFAYKNSKKDNNFN